MGVYMRVYLHGCMHVYVLMYLHVYVHVTVHAHALAGACVSPSCLATSTPQDQDPPLPRLCVPPH